MHRLLLLALVLAACQSQAPESASASETALIQVNAADLPAQEELGLTSAPPPGPEPAAARNRRLIRRAEIGLRVRDYASARAEVDGLARRFGAYVGGENEGRSDTEIRNRLTLRVPAERFEPLLAALVGVGDGVEYRTITADDVTEQWVDLEARLRARRAVEARYQEILARANTVEEVLAVEARLGETREAIEAAEGRLRYLRDQVGLSTITLVLTQRTATALAGPGFFGRLGDAFRNGWNGLTEATLTFAALWPLWLVGAALWFASRPLRRRLRTRRKAAV